MSETNGTKPDNTDRIKEAHQKRKGDKEGVGTMFSKGRPLPEIQDAPAPSPPAKPVSKTDRVREALRRLGADATRQQIAAEVGEPVSPPLFSTQRVILYGRRDVGASVQPSPGKPKNKVRDYKREKEQAVANRLKREANLKPLVNSLAERVAAQSKLLSRKAESSPQAAEVLLPLNGLVALQQAVRAIGGAGVARQVLDVLEG